MAASATTPDASTEEVRVAMALNGGVSLAIWMGGCAVELDSARRAHIDRNNGGPMRGRVYRLLCEALDRELVIDIMSGASAGGINGALLAAVISRGRQLDVDYLRTRWIELGDFSRLLQPLATREPQSLMSGHVFHAELEKTFNAVLGTAEDPAQNEASHLDEGERPRELQPVLDVTTTNLIGEELLFHDDWGETLTAREYRGCFRFRDRADYTAENLAAAARASASFPLAFEPWKVSGSDPCRLASFPKSRWVVDGGLLDNAPIRLALEAIPTRASNRQVRRYVCYVNGDPPEPEIEDDEVAPAPGLQGIVGAIVTLPRKAPFADELTAIEAAAHRSALNRSAEVPLLATDLAALVTTAEGLLPTYRQRRRLRSLQEILGQPRDAELAYQRIEDVAGELPWVPTSLAVPAPGTWGWGIQAARRVHHLALDLIRYALPDSETAGRTALLEARIEIDARLAELDRHQAEFESSPCVVGRLEALAFDGDVDVTLEMASLGGFSGPRDRVLYRGVVDTIATLYRVSVQLGARDNLPIGEALFGDGWWESTTLSDPMVTRFLQRALAIEVIRRAFSMSDVVEEAQELAFAQLTPLAPTPLLSRAPLTIPWRALPKAKLTGLILGHFGAFYRRSWRANDFMWGRLDAAARIVNMLVETDRARELLTRGEKDPAEVIAASLLEGADEADRLLIEEALDDAKWPPHDDPGERLKAALASDLTTGDASLTRIICVRAAQLEILREELPKLIDEAAEDERRGSSPSALDLPEPERLREAAGMIDALEMLRDGDPLPKRLGLDPGGEASSTLALRTISRAGLVSLSVLRGQVPFAQPLQILRALLLPVAGVVAQHWRNRAGVLLAFVAASWFLAARIVTTTDSPADLAVLSLSELLVGLITVLVVVGTAAVPMYRLAKGKRNDRLPQGLWVVALLATGFGATVALAWGPGPLDPGQLVVQPGAKAAPKALLLPTLLVVLGIVIVRVPLVRSQLAKLAQSAWSKALAVVAAVAAASLIAWAQEPLRQAISDGDGWQMWTALAAGIGAPLAAGAFLFLRDPIKRLRS